MKKALIALTLLIGLACMCAFAGAEGVVIDETNFPDEIFCAYVKENFDADGDGALDDEERKSVFSITVNGMGISTLLGIEHFSELGTLSCMSNKLISLDVSNNPKLRTLNCGDNDLRYLVLNDNHALASLICGRNKISTLELSKSAPLELLACNSNELAELDVSGLTQLKTLDCGYNPLTTLDLRTNAALQRLSFTHTDVTSLDLSGNPALATLECQHTGLTSLDLTQNPEVATVSCDYALMANVARGSEKTAVIPGQVVTKDGTVDLSAFPGLDVSQCSEWEGGAVNGTILTVEKGEENSTWVTFLYQGSKHIFIEVVTEEDPDADALPIDETNFPDEAFRAYVRETFDTDNDGKLNAEEITAAQRIDINNKGIATLQGIEHFPELTYLSCQRNVLTAVDVSANAKLDFLSVFGNQLAVLDVSKNPALTHLDCAGNKLSALDVRNNPALTHLWCGDNGAISKLDVTANAQLRVLSCERNNLTELDLSQNKDLRQLHCFDNKLTALDLSANTELAWMRCYNLPLTGLDVTGNPVLDVVVCDSALMGQVKRNDSTALIPYMITTTDGKVDLSAFPGFDAQKAANWRGGTLEGNVFTVDDGLAVSFEYMDGMYLLSFRVRIEEPAATGDVTGDGKTDIMDVIRLLKYVSGWKVDVAEGIGDVNGDGKTNIMDVIRLLKFVSGWDVTLA